ncbi:MAG: hypothetical protein Q9190_006552, partial [Brigantiaea leucoxantha]
MSSTTEESDWNTPIFPRIHQSSATNGPNDHASRNFPPFFPSQPLPSQQIGPGQSVFAVTTPTNHASPIRQSPALIPAPPLTVTAQNNSPALSFITPVNPALVRVANNEFTNPQNRSQTWDNSPPSATTQLENMPAYEPPPPRSIRGIKAGARRSRGGRWGRGDATKVKPASGSSRKRIKVEAADDGGPASATITPAEGTGSTRGRGRGSGRRGGRPRGSRAGASTGRSVKRKKEDEDDKNDSDASEIITPLPTQSRSGRKITHVTSFSPIVIDLEVKPTPLSSRISKIEETSTAAIPAVRKGRGKRTFARPVSSEAVAIEEREWFCADCEVLREERAHVEGKVSAESMSIVEKRRYLQCLPASHLVSLLLHATTLHPDLPVFSATRPTVERPPRPITHFIDPTAPPVEEDESYDLYPESEVLPYPKAGNGIVLPPELEDLELLIDDDFAVFSHVWDWSRNELYRRNNP